MNDVGDSTLATGFKKHALVAVKETLNDRHLRLVKKKNKKKTRKLKIKDVVNFSVRLESP